MKCRVCTKVSFLLKARISEHCSLLELPAGDGLDQSGFHLRLLLPSGHEHAHELTVDRDPSTTIFTRSDEQHSPPKATLALQPS